jgi:phytoene dehydrogenase-like protein
MAGEADVVVVGAGLAGLRCARALRASGRHVVVLEASDGPGGRVRTDLVDGYRCDRGFQLLNPAYPAVRRHVDVDSLDLRVFGRGVVVARDGGTGLVADPLRHPGLLGATVRSGYARPGELARLAGWLAPALGPVPRLLTRPDTALADSLDASGVTGRLRREVLDPFLTGVLAERGGASSTIFVRLLMRSFVRASPGVPARGMQALPDQLSTGLDVRLRTPVRSVRRAASGHEVHTDDGAFRARAVVVAVGPESVASLTPLPTPATKGLRTWWFATDELPDHPTFLRVDGRGAAAGPVVNTVTMTAVAPDYAPPGRHLVQATSLLPDAASETAVRRHLAELHGLPTDGWSLVTRHDVRHALPAQPPPADVRRPVDLGGGLFVAGDHRDTGSLQGALASGARAARAVDAHLAGAR